MKLLLLAALLCAAKADSFIPGNQYNYDFIARVVTGIPNIQKQWSGLAIKSKLVIQPTPSHLLLKLNDIMVERLNEQVHTFRGRRGNFQPQVEYNSFLSKSFKVLYEDGLVKELFVEHNEPEWSINFKKAIASLLNVNLKQEKLIQLYQEGTAVNRDPKSNYFTTMEESIHGECETSYTLRDDPFKSNATHKIFKVTKMHNLQNCNHRVAYEHNSIPSRKCFDCEPESTKEDLLQTYANTYYKMIGDRHQFLIQKAFGKSKHVFSPFTTNGESIMTKSYQMMRLRNSEPVREDIKTAYRMKKIENLSYTIPKRIYFNDMVNLKAAHHSYARYSHVAKVEQIISSMKKIVKDYDNVNVTNTLQKNLTSLYVEVIRQMSTLDYQGIHDIYSVYSKYYNNSAYKQRAATWDLFWNVLSDVGTNPAIMYGLELIRSKERSPSARSFLTKIPLVVKEPTELLLNELYGLCSHPNVLKCNQTVRACYWATADFVGQHCKPEPTVHEKSVNYSRSACRPDTKIKFFNHFEKKLNESNSTVAQSTYVVALAKLRDLRSLEILKPIVYGNTNLTLNARVQAVWSLYSLIGLYPEQLNQITYPSMFNDTEDHEIRIASFTVAISSNPSISQIQSIIGSMIRTKDHHVSNYMYTTLQYFSNSTYPCHKQVAGNIKQALEVLKVSNFTGSFSPKYSWKFYNGGFNDKYYTGGYTDISFIGSNNSYIPRSFHVTIHDYMFGRSMTPIMFGIRSQGLEKVVDKIFGPEGLLSKLRSPLDILKRSPRRVNAAAKELREIKNLLDITPKEYEDIVGQIYWSSYGQTDMIFFNDTDFKSLLEKGRITIPDIFSILKKGVTCHRQMYRLVVDKIMLHPTAAGFPVLVDAKLSSMTSINLMNLSMEVLPDAFVEQRMVLPENLKAKMETVLTHDLDFMLTMSALSPFDSLKHGAGYEHRRTMGSAVNGSMNYDFTLNKVSFDIIPIEQDLLHVHFEPFTFIDSYANAVSISNEKSFIPIGIHKFNHTTNYTVGHEYLGLGLNVNSTYYGYHSDYSSYKDFVMKNDLRSLLYYQWSIPTFQPFNFNVSLTNATKEFSNKISLSFRLKNYNLASANEYVPEFVEKDQDFERYVTEQKSTKPETMSIISRIQFHGPKTRKLEGEVVVQESSDLNFHRVAAKFKKTAFSSQERNSELCFSLKSNRPEIDWTKVKELKLNELPAYLYRNISLRWGQDCNSDKKIEVTMKFNRTQQQVELVENLPKYKSHFESSKYPYYQSFPHPAELKYNPYADLYYRCLNMSNQGHTLNVPCFDYFFRAMQLRRVSGSISYSKIPESISNITMKTLGYFNHMVFPHVDYYFSQSINRPKNVINFSANVSVHHPVYDAQLYLPNGNIFYSKVNMESYRPISLNYPYSFSRSPVEHYFTNNQHWRESSCSIDSHIHTFDNSSYAAPLTRCYHVLAKDCSPEELYSVLVANSTEAKYSKKLKVIIYEDVITIVPVNGELRVRRDGRTLDVAENKPYLQYQQVGVNKKLIYQITKIDKELFVINAPELGLGIAYGGNTTYVSLSNYYRGKQCGLCGNMNGRGDLTELEGPKRCHYTNTTAFTYSYAVQTSECKVPKFYKPAVCRPTTRRQIEDVCTKLRNQIVYEGPTKSEQVCFTTQPVPECSSKCKAVGEVKKRMNFHCLDIGLSYAKKLVQERRSRALKELSKKSVDLVKEITHPDRCVSK